MYERQSKNIKCFVGFMAILLSSFCVPIKANYGTPRDMENSIYYQRQRGQSLRGEVSPRQYTDEELRDIYYRNPDDALRGLLDGRYPLKGIIHVSPGLDNTPIPYRSRRYRPSRRERYRSRYVRTRSGRRGARIEPMGIPSSPKSQPLKSLPSKSLSNLENTRKSALEKHVSKVTKVSPAQYRLENIHKFAKEKTLNLLVIHECEKLIKYYPDSEEAKEAKRILDETQKAQKVLLEKKRREKAWISSITSESLRQ